jgi:AcrR family transcriptional regulator
MKTGQNKRIRSQSRAHRTRYSVGDALVSLMRERPYQSITVEDVLSRADISRSTFYSHFDGKDDALTSHYARFFDFIADQCMQAGRIAPVEFMLAHLADARFRDFYKALGHTGKMSELRADAVDRLAPKFESELVRLARGREHRVPLGVLARFVASSFMDLIDWWVENDAPYTPKEMEEMFERLIRPAISSAMS